MLKDFLQVLAILQTVLLSWQTASAGVTAALSGVSVTPMSTKAWISLDCLMPRTLYVAEMRHFYHIAAQLVLPVLYTMLMLLIFLGYAIYTQMRTRQRLWADVILNRLKAPIVCTLLVIVSYFYPSLAYAILGVFSCRYLDPSTDANLIDGEVRLAKGWYWSSDLNRQCFVDPGHRTLALALGLPGILLLLAYPILQGVILARQVAAGHLQATSDFFARYGHLVENFRPRLFYWGSIVELRKLVLVAVVLGLESTGIESQLLACTLVLLAYVGAVMGMLPYPYRVLNRLHLSSGLVLLAVVWINLFVAAGDDEGDALSAGMMGRRSLGLQLLSVLLTIGMVLVLLIMFGVRLYRQVKTILDVDQDGKVTMADINALLQKLQNQNPILAKVLACVQPRASTASSRGTKAPGKSGAVPFTTP